MKQKLSRLSKLLLILSAIALLASLFVPIWSIYLDAPQYPEGLRLQIWANAIAGDVDIINGLNHYIGMKTLHTSDFIEFTILPYIIAAYALLFAVCAFIGRKKWLYIAFTAFVLFGIVAMVDFWKWEYNYGHNLDPNAAIRVPGMAYQPPLIGFKQLLNFGAYSVPDIGGWLFVVAGALLLLAVLNETGFLNRFRKNKKPVMLLALTAATLTSCGSSGPQPIVLNKDACEFCKMSISDGRFVAELITTKGRAYKFDDLGCLFSYAGSLPAENIKNHYVGDYTKNNALMDASTAWYVHHESFRSPMAGNTAAFPSREAAAEYAQKNQATVLQWTELNNINHLQDGSSHEQTH